MWSDWFKWDKCGDTTVLKAALGWSVPLAVICGCAKSPVAPETLPGAAMQLTSTAFQEGRTIPMQCTGDGKDVSPPLHWSGAPGTAKSFALICDDPDAPRGTWVHWVLWNLPPNQHELSEGMPTNGTLPDGAQQGKNDFGKL